MASGQNPEQREAELLGMVGPVGLNPYRGPGREAASEAGIPVRRPWAE
jgi:hypothetical protein